VRAYETNASVGEDRHTDTKKKKKKFEISLYQDANISANNEYLSLHFCDIDFTTMRYTSLSLSLSLSNDECLAGILLRTSASFL
jgi:hypothetical protein